MLKKILVTFLLFSLIKSHFGQCDSTIIQGDFFIYNDTTLSGTYYILGEFKILSGATVNVSHYSTNSCGNLKIYADKIRIEGDIDADFAGLTGGSGGL